ncbi:zinc finger protein weckle [Anoplophora glabripennis]|uniref:Zinc finger protein n=1 Tax=Anoplophora glabripennis TaxID=217634 RepID=V5GQM1_ANOGL|nr:zinc finger protein weckle-like [Anoplophora glabripennis]XP_023312502.1 zinc finger protein weckle [Anoplophora glabripennis]
MITHQDAEEAKIYKCDNCPFQTKHKYGTIKHALVHTDPSEMVTFKCLTCRRGFKRKEQLRKHVLTHMKSNLPKFRCDECDYESIWKDNLTIHTLKHRNASELTMFKCHLCPHETKIKASLRLHLVT